MAQNRDHYGRRHIDRKPAGKKEGAELIRAGRRGERPKIRQEQSKVSGEDWYLGKSKALRWFVHAF